jgi:cation diffusion facilitator family transporter
MSQAVGAGASVDRVAAGGTAAGIRATWIGSIVNLFLAVFKTWVGFLSRSQALVADGVHSLSDLFSDVIVILGLRWGRKSEDEDHPFGHARIETISSMVVGVVLIAVGLGLAQSAVDALGSGERPAPSLLAIWAAAASIVLKEGMYWYTVVVGRRLRSPALIGNAWHHRSDALSSVAVLAGVGAGYADPAWSRADAYAALLVTFFILRVGVNLTWAAFKELSDTAPAPAEVEAIAGKAREVEGVRQVHDIRARYSGPQIFVEVHIVVDPELTVRQGHEIARAVKWRLLDDQSDVTRVIVHVDPDTKPGE